VYLVGTTEIRIVVCVWASYGDPLSYNTIQPLPRYFLPPYFSTRATEKHGLKTRLGFHVLAVVVMKRCIFREVRPFREARNSVVG
jgi:hypothetical protein